MEKEWIKFKKSLNYSKNLTEEIEQLMKAAFFAGFHSGMGNVLDKIKN